jgi:hypothetical protein
MTKRDIYLTIRYLVTNGATKPDPCATADDIVALCDKELAALDKKRADVSRKTAAFSVDQQILVEILSESDEPMMIEDIVKAAQGRFEGKVSPQRIATLLTKLGGAVSSDKVAGIKQYWLT